MANTDRRQAGGSRGTGVSAVIMTLFFLSPTISAISPIMSSIAKSYPAVSPTAIGYVMTITAATQAITAVIAGSIAGKKVRFKPMLITASLIYVLAGCFPYFLQDGSGFAALLVSRALLGVGIGIIMPFSNALILAFFSEENQRTKLIGWGNVMLNGGTIVSNLIGGMLCSISWHTTFLAYSIGLVLLVLSLIFMREPELVTETKKAFGKPEAKIPMVALAFILFFLLNAMLAQPVITYNSQLLAGAGMDSPLLAATMISLFSIGGAAMSAMFSQAYKLFRNKLLPMAFCVTAASMLVCYIACLPEIANPVIYGTGVVMLGIGLLATTCFTPLMLSKIVSPDMQSTAMGFVSFSMAAGGFLSTPFAQLVSVATGVADVSIVVVASGLCAAALSIYLFFFIGRYDKKDG